MITFCILFLITSVRTHKVFESTEDIESPQTNITHLYPVHLNITSIKNNKINEEIQSARENIKLKPNNNESDIELLSKSINDLNNETNKEIIKTHEELKSKPLDKTTWKIEAAFSKSDLTVKDDKVENKNASKVFRPSQLLGYILDEEVSQKTIYEDFSREVRKPDTVFKSSPKDVYYPTTTNIPREFLQNYKPFPYEFEGYTKPRGSWSLDTLESKPTEEVPLKVPAGGLYKLPDVFNEHSILDTSHEDLSYVINEEVTGHRIRKRVNPWKKILRFVTAIIPAGLLISALTPSLITLSPAPGNHYPSNLRRSDTNMADLEPISERCRRRLLCELHSDTNYEQYISSPNRSHSRCYKIHCEDTQALFKMLQWLLSYHNPADDRARDLT